MKKMAMRLVAVLLLIGIWCVPVGAEQYLIPVGQVIGLELLDNTVTVAAFDDIWGSKAKEAGLREGDKILAIDEKTITCAEDVRSALTCSNGRIRLRLERQGKQQTLTISPHITKDGPKLGVFLKQGVTGIGTVTWYDPQTGRFGSLGHGVNGADGGILKMISGTAYEAKVVSVKQGRPGEPGLLRGAVTGTQAVGSLCQNTSRGLFGQTEVGWQGQALPVAEDTQVALGSAKILATVDGKGVQEYSVEICKLYPKTKSGDKNMLIRITDPLLLQTTGGIVQGMSGSPIIQDGKLVGAVTHVLVNDPTTGYGIFIENMLDAAA